ncbi:MAG: hypothetical protein AAF721_40035 [Myxococcota bacterium]
MHVDASQFPSVARFIAALPEGLDSYPQCRAKASMVRNLADEVVFPGHDLAALPEPLRLFREVPVSSWISETHSQAMMLAIYDRCFDDLAQFGAYAHRQGRALLVGPLYAIAFKVVTPAFLVKTATLRWRMFHRGTELTARRAGEASAEVRIDHPPGLFGEVVRRGFCEGMRAAIDLATGGGTTFELTGSEPRYATLRLRWTGS